MDYIDQDVGEDRLEEMVEHAPTMTAEELEDWQTRTFQSETMAVIAFMTAEEAQRKQDQLEAELQSIAEGDGGE